MKAALLVMLLWALMPLSSNGFDTLKLVEHCEQSSDLEDMYDELVCTSYLRGMFDQLFLSHQVRIAMDNKGFKAICIPEGFSLEQMKLMFLKKVRESPEEAHNTSEMIINSILIKAYGMCESGEECSC